MSKSVCKQGLKLCSSAEVGLNCTERCRTSVRYSAVIAFQRCRRYYMHRYVDCTTAEGPESEPLRIGRAVHAGLAAYWRGDRANCHYVAGDAFEGPLKDYVFSAVEVMVAGYRTFWAATDLHAEGVSVDDRFATVINGMNIIASPDAIVCELDGELAIYEHKTTSASDISAAGYWYLGKQTDIQTTLYAAVARLRGYDVKSVVYDVLRVPAHKAKDPTDAVLSQPAKYFARHRHKVDQRMVDAAMADVAAVHDAQVQCAKTGRYDRNGSACQDFGRQCEYFEACWGGNLGVK